MRVQSTDFGVSYFLLEEHLTIYYTVFEFYEDRRRAVRRQSISIFLQINFSIYICAEVTSLLWQLITFATFQYIKIGI